MIEKNRVFGFLFRFKIVIIHNKSTSNVANGSKLLFLMQNWSEEGSGVARNVVWGVQYGIFASNLY
jgi:hypothetical protein